LSKRSVAGIFSRCVSRVLKYIGQSEYREYIARRNTRREKGKGLIYVVIRLYSLVRDHGYSKERIPFDALPDQRDRWRSRSSPGGPSEEFLKMVLSLSTHRGPPFYSLFYPTVSEGCEERSENADGPAAPRFYDIPSDARMRLTCLDRKSDVRIMK